jgi:hypothetical protein
MLGGMLLIGMRLTSVLQQQINLPEARQQFRVIGTYKMATETIFCCHFCDVSLVTQKQI